MSGWTAYSDNLLQSGFFKQSFVLGTNGSIAGYSGAVTISQQDAIAIAGIFANPQNAFAGGIPCGGVKYVCIRSDGASLYGKKDKAGCCFAKCNTVIIGGVYDDPVQPGQATNAVEKLAQYLRDVGC